jgi:orotidine-5'-phosphate decarboxylase
MEELDVEPFADRLMDAIQRTGTPALVGLDPRAQELPAALTNGRDGTADSLARAYSTFCREVIDAVAPLVPAVKPQAAFFEALGPAGMQSLAETIAHARKAGLLVILDGKRNDIGSTAAAYAQAYLGAEQSAWGADALTVSPYLGDDSLTPFVDASKANSAGIFVLVKTSNPGGKTFQDLICDGRPLYRHAADLVERLARETAGGFRYGAVGAVVGATYPEQLAELRSAMPHAPLLVPGFGAQGGTARDVAAAFDDRGLGAVINSSRDIIFAYRRREYKDRFPEGQWTRAVEAAAREMIDQLRADTPAGKLAQA